MKNVFIVCAVLASSAAAHMQLSQPYPIRSPLNKDQKGKKDYSYTNPLSTSGSDFPCKGYANDDFQATADYKPGSNYEIKLAGSATHKGGSCQISLSYDKGKTFHVIKSILGGCPIDKDYKFTVPSDAPSGEALLGWTWFNKVGNREMYMNCAQVNIGGGSGKRDISEGEISDEQAGNATMHVSDAAASSFKELPPIFVANVNGPGKCTTEEGKDVNFPKPGPVVDGKVGGKGYSCEGSADFLGSSKAPNMAEKAESNDDQAEKMVGANPTHAADDDDKQFTIMETTAPTATGKKHAKQFGKPSAWEHGGGDGGDKGQHHDDDQQKGSPPGSIICADDGLHFSQVTNQGPPIERPVADGTACRDGKITWA